MRRTHVPIVDAHWLRTAVRGRCGAALVEGTIVLAVFLTIVFALFDLGLAVMRENSLAEAARRLARAAIVHGDLAEPEQNSWGPARYSGTAADDTEYAEAIQLALVTIDPADVEIEITWPDNDNQTGDRVTVAVRYDHHTILPRVLGASTMELVGRSTMRIEH